MPTIPQRIASAFAVLCGHYGDVTKMAQDRERSRQSLYREAQQVADAVDGAAAQARIDELQQQLAEQRAEIRVLRERLEHAVEITPDKQHEFATVAQAEGVSLSVARRLLRVVSGPKSTRAEATLRLTPSAWATVANSCCLSGVISTACLSRSRRAWTSARCSARCR